MASSPVLLLLVPLVGSQVLWSLRVQQTPSVYQEELALLVCLEAQAVLS